MTNLKNKRKERYAPLPTRVIADARLSALQLRILGSIAAHDQFKRNGLGCYASHKRLAELTRSHPTNVSKAIERLIAFGYLTKTRLPKDNRRRIYSVIYNEDDKRVFWRDRKSEDLRSLVPGREIDGQSNGLTHGVNSPFSAQVYSPKGDKYRNKIDASEDDLGKMGNSGEKDVISDRAAQIVADVQSENTGTSDAIGALNKERDRALHLGNSELAFEIEKLAEAVLDSLDINDIETKKRQARDSAKPSRELLDSLASRQARDLT